MSNRSQRSLVFCSVLSVAGAFGQGVIADPGSGGAARLQATDLAVLDARTPRSDLHCSVVHIKPELGWDFTFHTGYQAAFSLRDLAGETNEVTILFRVFPQEHPDDATYMVQKLRVPRLNEQNSQGRIEFPGVFTLGEGKFHVDWLAREKEGRVCATSWDVETKLEPKDGALREWIPQSLIQPVRPLFADETQLNQTLVREDSEGEAPVSQSAINQSPMSQSLMSSTPVSKTGGDRTGVSKTGVSQGMETRLPHVSIIVNFDPPKAWAVEPRQRDIESLLGILRRIGRDPRIGTYSVIACSLGAQRVVYAQERANKLDLSALGTALLSLKLGVVDAKELASANGPAQFATNLVADHLKKEQPDALIVLGRKAAWNDGISRDALQSVPRAPLFYLSYNTERQVLIQQDPFSSIVKRLRGVEYAIYRPNDLFKAWTDVVARIGRTK